MFGGDPCFSSICDKSSYNGVVHTMLGISGEQADLILGRRAPAAPLPARILFMMSGSLLIVFVVIRDPR